MYVDYSNGFHIDQRNSKHAGNVLVVLNKKLLRCQQSNFYKSMYLIFLNSHLACEYILYLNATDHMLVFDLC